MIKLIIVPAAMIQLVAGASRRRTCTEKCYDPGGMTTSSNGCRYTSRANCVGNGCKWRCPATTTTTTRRSGPGALDTGAAGDSQYAQRSGTNQKCEKTGDAETEGLSIDACYQKAAANNAPFFSFTASHGYCFYSTSCDNPTTGTGWDWNIYEVKGGTAAADISALEPYSEECCKIAAQQAGLMLGGEGYKFADDHLTKGCYTFTSGTYKGYAYYGTGGTEAENKAALNEGYLIRIQGYDQCGEKGAANDAPGPPAPSPPAPSPPPPAPGPLTCTCDAPAKWGDRPPDGCIKNQKVDNKEDCKWYGCKWKCFDPSAPTTTTTTEPPPPEPVVKLLTSREQSGCNCCYSKEHLVTHQGFNQCWIGDTREKRRCEFYDECGWQCQDATDFSCNHNGYGAICIGAGDLDVSSNIRSTCITLSLLVIVGGFFALKKFELRPKWREAWEKTRKKTMTHIIAIVKILGGLIGLIFKFVAIGSIVSAYEGLVDLRKERNLNNFDTCCRRMTAAEENCGTAITFSLLQIFLKIFILLMKGGGVYNPLKESKYNNWRTKVFMVCFKNLGSILFCIFVGAGLGETEEASFDWGEGHCPPDGLFEEAMEEINDDFKASIRNTILSIIAELVMIEVTEQWEEWKEKRKNQKETAPVKDVSIAPPTSKPAELK